MMEVKLAYCTCNDRCQDLIYGKGMRVHIPMNDGKRSETTGWFEAQCAACGIKKKLG